jgi:Zn-dependent protease
MNIDFFRRNFFLIAMAIFIAQSAMREGGILTDPVAYIRHILILLPGIIIGITVHEFAHAFSAYKLGDDTPKLQGRVSLNPLRHIDPIGFVCLLLGGFGWGKAVEVNPYAFRKQRRDELIVDLAGVVTNFVFAVIFMLLYKVVMQAAATASLSATAYSIISEVIISIVTMNLVLMVFNLLPIPPLDGFGVATSLFDLRKYNWYPFLYQNGSFILLALIFLGFISRVIGPIINEIFYFLVNLIIY